MTSDSSVPLTPEHIPISAAQGEANAYPFLSPSQTPDELGRIGDYRVLRRVGTGGMGIVFEAEEMILKRRVALKVLKPELALDADNRERFLREARAVAAIRSDHVITIFHVADGDTPYLAMPFLEGESLQSRIDRQPPLTLRAALEITRQAAVGLVAAHERGLIHRDIKPANLWLEPTETGILHTAPPTKLEPDADPSIILQLAPTITATSTRVLLLDFGLVRRTGKETSLTSTGFIVGTPNYMSPEQASGFEVDGRSDLFALGCVLYTMLVGNMPFAGETPMAVMMSLASRTPTLVNAKNPAIPPKVAELVAQLLEKKPDRRLPSARHVVAVLEQLLATITDDVPLPPAMRTRSSQTQAGGETIVPGNSRTQSSAQSPPIVPQPAPLTGKSRAAKRLAQCVAIVCFAGILVAAGFGLHALLRSDPAPTPPPAEPIVIGILHSQSGTMAASEKPVLDATLMAIEELNAAGGVLGRQIRPVVVDGKSEANEFTAQATRLLTEEKAVALFGCWTSASRKAVRDVLQYHPGVLFYPVQYEGLEISNRIVYMGPAPNQQLIPALEFLVDTLGKRKLYVIGSDYVYPRAAYEIIKDWVAQKVAAGVPVEIVGNMLIPLNSTETKPAVTDLVRKGPDAIINTLNGGVNLHFFRELRKQGIKPEKVPTLSLSITENEIRSIDPTAQAGDFLAASYFQTIDRPQSQEFVRKLRERYEPAPAATDPMAAAYTSVNLWARAVEAAGSPDPNAVIKVLRGMRFDGVRTHTLIDADLMHAWLPARIGQIRPDGLVDLVAGAGSETPLRPIPYPATRKPEQWESFLRSLYFEWNARWQPPDKK